MTIALVLDTNVLRQEGLASRNMQLLARLTSSGEVALFVPDFVRREFLSQRTLEVEAQVAKCETALAEIGKQLAAKSETRADIDALKGLLKQVEARSLNEIPEEFEQWGEACKAKSLSFNPAAMDGVLDDYFAGAGAFRKVKHREDIPDAIVSASMRTLFFEHPAVHVAIKDGAFRKHLQTDVRYVLVDGLTEFFDLGDVKAIIEKLDAQNKNVAAVKAVFSDADFQDRLTAFLRGATEMLAEVYVEEDGLEGVNHMEIGYGYSLNFAQANAIADVQYSDVSYIAEGHFSIDLTIRTKARIDFAASYYEVQHLPTTREVDEWSMDGDGYCDLREVRDVLLLGHVELLFDPSFDPAALKAHSHYLASAESRISVELDIQNAAIL